MTPLFNITLENCYVGQTYMSIRKAVAVVVLILLPIVVAGQAAAQEMTRPYRAGELLVKYKTGTGSMDRSALIGAGLVRSAQAIGQSPIHRVMLEQGTTVEQALAAYAGDPNVEIAEPNYIIRAQTIPDDTDFFQQWGLYNTGQAVGGYLGAAGIDIDAPQAWDIITGFAVPAHDFRSARLFETGIEQLDRTRHRIRRRTRCRIRACCEVLDTAQARTRCIPDFQQIKIRGVR